jgi:hypothetical protein
MHRSAKSVHLVFALFSEIKHQTSTIKHPQGWLMISTVLIPKQLARPRTRHQGTLYCFGSAITTNTNDATSNIVCDVIIPRVRMQDAAC